MFYPTVLNFNSCCMPMHHCNCGNNIFSQMMQFGMMQSMMNMFFAPRQQVQVQYAMPVFQMPVVRPNYSYMLPAVQNNSIFASQAYVSPFINSYNYGTSLINTQSQTRTASTSSATTTSSAATTQATQATSSSTGPKKVFSKNEYVQIACKAAKKYGVDERLVLAVIEQESKFKNNLTSHAGAQGLMQLMPATARSLGVTNPMDPEQNIDGGVRLLKKLLDKYNGNVKNALAAYNWGPGNVDKYLAGKKNMPNETKNYIKIADRYQNYSVA